MKFKIFKSLKQYIAYSWLYIDPHIYFAKTIFPGWLCTIIIHLFVLQDEVRQCDDYMSSINQSTTSQL